MNTYRYRHIIAAFAVLLIAGCTQWKETKAVKDTVVRYNSLLSEGYRNLNMAPLLRAATPEHTQKVYYHMAAMGEGREKMVMVLKRINFSGIKIGPDGKAEARTIEDWDYTHINIDSGQTVAQDSITYELVYRLVRDQDSWLVADVVIEKETKTS